MSDRLKPTPEEKQAARLTAFVLGELSDDEQSRFEAELSGDQREECDELERLAAAALNADRAESLPEASPELRESVESKLANDSSTVELNKATETAKSRGRLWFVWATGLSLLVAAVAVPSMLRKDLAPSLVLKSEIAELERVNAALRTEAERANDDRVGMDANLRVEAGPALAELQSREKQIAEQLIQQYNQAQHWTSSDQSELVSSAKELNELGKEVSGLRAEIKLAQQDRDEKFSAIAVTEELQHRFAEESRASGKAPTASDGLIEWRTAEQAFPAPTSWGVRPNARPSYVTPPATTFDATVEEQHLTESLGLQQGVPAPNQLAAGPNARGAGSAVVRFGRSVSSAKRGQPVASSRVRHRVELSDQLSVAGVELRLLESKVATNEQYSQIVDNRFVAVSDEPLSTFSIDVDTASYANARRFLTQNQLPPANAIRIEEFINYFNYDYAGPKDNEPFSVNLEVAECPWQPAHQLVRIGLKGKEIPQKERPASNVVFLLDVSGSMQDTNKLPLLKQAMKLLTDQLTENDRVSIVTYAGNAGLALDSTNGESKQTIRDAIDALNANGSTNGSAGIQLAYEKATESFIKDGANRVILATDGDLNVGVTSDDALVTLITEKAASGVFLTVLGFGEGNLKDGKLEKLADNGNGMYAYIDSLREARKVLVEQITGSLVTIAKDVKIQVEFNPAEVAGYRLLGYENRLMAAPDFDNDAKDAGEIGAGHTVTALYEIAPTEIPERLASTAPKLKYQQPAKPAEPPKELTPASETGELLTVFLRYKRPDANESMLREFTVDSKRRAFDDASVDFRFASAVASFGMVLRNSEFKGNASLASVDEVASSAIGSDTQGHRTEFLDLVRKASALQPQSTSQPKGR